MPVKFNKTILLSLLLLINYDPGFGAQVESETEPARYIDMGEGRNIYLKCQGKGSPTVILESGYHNNSDVWTFSLNDKQPIFPEIASFTRVCVYDRPGTIGWTVNALGRSDNIQMPRKVEDLVEDLHMVLQKAQLKEPYILVGHSLGGLLVRLYASKYPKEVVGLVLVDSYPEGLRSLVGSTWPDYLKILNSPMPGIKDPDHFEQIDFNEATTAMEKSAQSAPLKTLLLTVLSRGLPVEVPVVPNPNLNSEAFEEAWQKGQSQLVLLAPHAKQVIATKSQHYIQYYEPGLIIQAIQEMVSEVRKNKPND
ncbi:MAG: alpha/beta fold hydrolase [Tatlockia sp.]|nr:alpha/beta fold hydrolase [Tatlockia sp.]